MTNYVNRTLKDLKEVAKKRGLKGYSQLNKADLIKVLQRKSKILDKKDCKKKLSKKIAKNTKEYKSRKQAIAVAYSQVKKSHPECKKSFKYK